MWNDFFCRSWVAPSVTSIIPIALLFIVAQRYFIAGVTAAG